MVLIINITNILEMRSDINIILVPTVIKGVNLDHVPQIFQFAVQNRDVIRGISFQPVTFSGRIDRADRGKKRVTPYDIMKLLEKGTEIRVKDFIPNYKVLRVFQLLLNLTDKPQLSYTQAFECGNSAIYMFENGNPRPVQDYFDIGKLFELVKERVKEMDGWDNDWLVKIKVMRVYSSFIIKECIQNPKNLNLLKVLFKKGSVKNKIQALNYPLIVSILHLQDDYNFQIERTQSCPLWTGIVVKGKVNLYPYCQYNLLHRGGMNETGKL